MEIKKIIHIGDVHIRKIKYHDEYLDVFKTLLNDVKTALVGLKREEVRVAILGDLVHNKTEISNEQLLLTTWLLKKLEEIAPLIIIPGNHDFNLNNKDRMDSITPLIQFLPDNNINYFKESKCYLDKDVVWCVYSLFEDNKTPNIEAAKLEFGNDKTYIGLFHGPLLGAKTDLGYTIDHGAELKKFKDLDFCLCADIHMRQALIYDKTPIIYVGSTIQQGFGEKIKGHGFLLWDVETRTYTEHDVKNKYPFFNFKIKSINDIENNAEELVNY